MFAPFSFFGTLVFYKNTFLLFYTMISFEVSAKKLCTVAIFAGVLLAILTWLVWNGMTERADKAIISFLEGARSPLWNGIFLILTYLGSVNFMSVGTFAGGVILLIKKRMGYFYLLALSVSISTALVFIIKGIIGRLRPADAVAVYTETSFSFPSGHTTLSVVFYGVLAYILSQRHSDWGYRTNILFGWIFFMAMIGFSRMYLGVHYASDVLGGYLTGFLCLSTGIILFEKYSQTEK
jgi:undecaprenyl-diphosphatase